MILPFRREGFTPPDNRLAVLEKALRHFAGSKESGGRSHTLLFTDSLRPTPGFRGVTEAQAVLLEQHGYAKLGTPQRDGRRSVALTGEGMRVRDMFARRPR